MTTEELSRLPTAQVEALLAERPGKSRLRVLADELRRRYPAGVADRVIREILAEGRPGRSS